MTRTIHFAGYFNGEGDEPAFDPKLTVPCPICMRPLTEEDKENNMRTHSLMLSSDDRSYFYRTHKSCSEGLSEEASREIDGMIFLQESAIDG